MRPRHCTMAIAALSAACLSLGLADAAPAPADHPRLTLQALRAKYAETDGKIAKIEGVDVYYKDEGHGPVLLMIHGSVSTLHTWDGMAAKLRSRYRIVRYDIPPQGLSGPVSDAQAAKLQPADIAEALLTQLHVAHATVIGVSSGGTLAIALAAKRPDLVDRLILSNAPSDPVKTDHLQQPPALLAAQADAKATGFQSMAFWNAFLDFFSGDPNRISTATRQQYYDMNRRVPEPNALALVAKVADHPAAVAAMAKVHAPTLLIWGGSDKLLPPSAAHTLELYLTNAQVSLEIMPDVGHYPPLEAPARFAQIVEAYIEAAVPLTDAAQGHARP